jgi:uncharacterized protein YegL
MKAGSAEIIVVMDRSGSMDHIRTDMEGGFDTFIEEQKKIPGECAVTLVKFDHEYEIEYQGKPLAEVPKLKLVPRGRTALFDAVGKTIAAVGERLEAMPEATRPERVLFVVITDGCENDSKEWTGAKVAEKVKHQTDKYNWCFVYMGANQDAFKSAREIGIVMAQNFKATPQGTGDLMRGLSVGSSNYRSSGKYGQ